MLLNRDIGEVNKHVIQFTQTGCVLDSAKPTETKSIPIREKKTILIQYVVMCMIQVVYTYPWPTVLVDELRMRIILNPM